MRALGPGSVSSFLKIILDVVYVALAIGAGGAALLTLAGGAAMIDPALLDDNAVRVVRTLKDAGFEAYIVGGAVRDLLVGLRPKDFDVATDALPEEVIRPCV